MRHAFFVEAFSTTRRNHTHLMLFAIGLVAIFTLLVPGVVIASTTLVNGGNAANVLPNNFTRVTVASGLNNPVQSRFAPNGNIYIAQQCGTIRLVKNGALVGTPVIAIPNTQCDMERGLLGIALDGNFGTNGYLYAAYTNTDGHSRLARFTVINGVASPGSETILYKFTQPSAVYHNISDVEWGPDGKLWVLAGDGYTCGSACGTEAQSLNSPQGKLLRFNPDGSAPADNPFHTASAPQKYIYAMGFRSNFRMTFMVNGTPMVGDVGFHNPSEDKLQRFYFIAKPNGSQGAQNISNGGWCPPSSGGGCTGYEYHAPCTSPANANANPNNGETNCPFYEYSNNPSPIASNAITGFVQYAANAYPPSYKNVLFYSEYGTQTVHYLTFTDSTYTKVASDTVFDDAANTTVDLEVGPDGNLYSTAIYQNTVYKYVYNGGGNPTPTPGGGAITVSNLQSSDTANAANWSIQQNIRVGNVQYGDRNYTLTAVPPSLAGSTWIRTANGSKTYTGNPTATFNINQTGTVYVAIDTRLPRPAWIDSSWTNTGMALTNTEVGGPHPQTLFAKVFPAGTVTLGPDSLNAANAFLMYSVIVTGGGSVPTPTPTVTNTPTPTSTPPTGLQLGNLMVGDAANAKAWSLQTNFGVGGIQYGDRNYTLSTIPAALGGASWIRSANASKAYLGTPTVSFSINQTATVYVLVDVRMTRPTWVDQTWTNTGLSVTNNEAAGSNTFTLYSKTFPAGIVALGPNGNTSYNMYTVVVK